MVRAQIFFYWFPKAIVNWLFNWSGHSWHEYRGLSIAEEPFDGWNGNDRWPIHMFFFLFFLRHGNNALWPYPPRLALCWSSAWVNCVVICILSFLWLWSCVWGCSLLLYWTGSGVWIDWINVKFFTAMCCVVGWQIFVLSWLFLFCSSFV